MFMNAHDGSCSDYSPIANRINKRCNDCIMSYENIIPNDQVCASEQILLCKSECRIVEHCMA